MGAILILDDENLVRDIAARALTKAGYHAIPVADPEEAVRIGDSFADEISLLITNHRLPKGQSGREVAERLLRSRPNMRILHISGYSGAKLRNAGSIIPGGFFLGKPFLPSQLLAKVREILGQ